MSVYQTQVEGKILQAIEASLLTMGFEIVRVKIMHGKGDLLQIMIERTDGLNITIEDCELAGRHISAIMDVEDPIEGRYRLEISSAGLDRPLTREKDFANNIGNYIKLSTYTPINRRRRFSGTIISINGSSLQLAVDGLPEEATIELNNIQEASLTLPATQNKNLKTKSKR